MPRSGSNTSSAAMYDDSLNIDSSFDSSEMKPSPSLDDKIGKRAYRAASRVENEMLQHSQVVDPAKVQQVVKLECDEVLLGDLLGTGEFSHVTGVHRIEPKAAEGSGIMRRKRQELMTNSALNAYSIKFLRSDLSPDKFCRGAAEMVVEMNLLSSLGHASIIKVHGVSREGPIGFQNGNGYFLVLDRLHDTLDKRLQMWRKMQERTERSNNSDSSTTEAFLLKRLQVAHDISSAFEYLHSRKILYRALKPSNLAFNQEGRLVLFDFGLARELEEAKLSADGINYEFSGNKGSLQYMAPENGSHHPYGLASDVYSIAMLLWQICSLADKPYPELKTRDQYLERVVRNKERPAIPAGDYLADSLQYLIRSSWSDDSGARPPMKQFHRSLGAEIQFLKDIQQATAQSQHQMTTIDATNTSPIPPSMQRSAKPPLSPLSPAMSPGWGALKAIRAKSHPKKRPPNRSAAAPSASTTRRPGEHQILANEALYQAEQILEGVRNAQKQQQSKTKTPGAENLVASDVALSSRRRGRGVAVMEESPMPILSKQLSKRSMMLAEDAQAADREEAQSLSEYKRSLVNGSPTKPRRSSDAQADRAEAQSLSEYKRSLMNNGSSSTQMRRVSASKIPTAKPTRPQSALLTSPGRQQQSRPLSKQVSWSDIRGNYAASNNSNNSKSSRLQFVPSNRMLISMPHHNSSPTAV